LTQAYFRLLRGVSSCGFACQSSPGAESGGGGERFQRPVFPISQRSLDTHGVDRQRNPPAHQFLKAHGTTLFCGCPSTNALMATEISPVSTAFEIHRGFHCFCFVPPLNGPSLLSLLLARSAMLPLEVGLFAAFCRQSRFHTTPRHVSIQLIAGGKFWAPVSCLIRARFAEVFLRHASRCPPHPPHAGWKKEDEDEVV